jgi:hypothetical protein
MNEMIIYNIIAASSNSSNTLTASETTTISSTFLSRFVHIPSYSPTQPIDGSTYTIVGERSCSAILQMTGGGGSLGIKGQLMLIDSYINGTLYHFEALSTQPNFGHLLPIFFHMLRHLSQ